MKSKDRKHTHEEIEFIQVKMKKELIDIRERLEILALVLAEIPDKKNTFKAKKEALEKAIKQVVEAGGTRTQYEAKV